MSKFTKTEKLHGAMSLTFSEHFADEYDTSKEGLIAAIKSCFKDNEDLKARALKLCEEFGDYADYI